MDDGKDLLGFVTYIDYNGLGDDVENKGAYEANYETAIKVEVLIEVLTAAAATVSKAHKKMWLKISSSHPNIWLRYY